MLVSLLCGVLVVTAAYGEVTREAPLRVCADPNNLPYSNRALEGFENKIAALMAADLERSLEFTWFPQRMGFIRNTLKSWDDQTGRFRCDLVIGVPQGFDMSDTTRAYYRSTYAIVLKAKGRLGHVTSALQFAELPATERQGLKIGAFVPSASVDWLDRYGYFENTRFFQAMTGDAADYPGKIIEDELIPGHLDVVLIWGPIAGYFARQHPDADLRILPLRSEPGIRFDFAMTMGIRRREPAWKAQVELTMARLQGEISNILLDYQVPLVMEPNTATQHESVLDR